MDVARLTQMLSVLRNEPRLRIIVSLETDSTYVSELARRLGMSRPLPYRHLDRLEAAGLIESGLEQPGESRVRKYYWVAPFQFEVTSDYIRHLTNQEQRGESS